VYPIGFTNELINAIRYDRTAGLGLSSAKDYAPFLKAPQSLLVRADEIQ